MSFRVFSIVALLLASQVHGAFGQSPVARAPLTERERAIHLLNRATYGTRPEDVEEVLRIGREAWIDRQLHPDQVEPDLLTPDTVDPSLRFVPIEMPSAPADAPFGGRTLVTVGLGGSVSAELLATKILRSVRSQRQLEQVMTDFWFNHFSVSERKESVQRVLADYEDAVRRSVFGSFHDLLLTTAQHPAMLMYLDNFVNGKPLLEGGISINENYARELLELHTLGVAGGYTQQDVIDVARALTGWSIPIFQYPRQMVGPALLGGLGFEFRAIWHDLNEKRVLGRTLPAGRGVEDGVEVLELLARHPSTARHVATKLARHFVSDEPPPELVTELERVFLDTDGDLAAVTRALFTSEHLYQPTSYRAKFRRPFEFVIAALRLTDAEIGAASTVILRERLRTFRHLPYNAASPMGYPSTLGDWVGASAMLERINFANELTGGGFGHQSRLGGVVTEMVLDSTEAAPITMDAWRAAGLEAERPDAAQPASRRDASLSILTRALLEQLIQGAPITQLEVTILEAMGRQPADADLDTLSRRALTLALGSPEFQRY